MGCLGQGAASGPAGQGFGTPDRRALTVAEAGSPSRNDTGERPPRRTRQWCFTSTTTALAAPAPAGCRAVLLAEMAVGKNRPLGDTAERFLQRGQVQHWRDPVRTGGGWPAAVVWRFRRTCKSPISADQRRSVADQSPTSCPLVAYQSLMNRPSSSHKAPTRHP